MDDLHSIAKRLLASGKGILAADESVASANKHLKNDAGVWFPNAETRRRYRELFLAAPGIEPYLSGVILFDETARQSANDGTPFPKLLERRGIMPGIKVDMGLHKMPGHPLETYTKGLEGLDRRLAEYRAMGCLFAKWRAAFPQSRELPSEENIRLNAMILARYAQACHRNGIAPMVEPEVLINGDHSLETSERVTTAVIKAAFEALDEHRVDRSAVVLKTSMAISGDAATYQAGPEEVGEATARMLREAVPTDAAGVVFLSGGQGAVQATQNLNAVARRGPFPWPVTFSYARALQGPSLKIWRGKEGNVAEARGAFVRRLELNAQASEGEYQGE